MPFKAPENPKCPKCGKSVYHAEARVVGDVSFHKECYKCSMCNKMLDSTNSNMHENVLYCKTCHGRKFGPKGYGFGGGAAGLSMDTGSHLDRRREEVKPYKPPKAAPGEGCPRCGGKVFAAEEMLAKGKSYHRSCFNCKACRKPLDSVVHCDGPDNNVYCKVCYGKAFGPKGYGFGAGAGTLTCGEETELFLSSSSVCYGKKFGPKGYGFGHGGGTLQCDPDAAPIVRPHGNPDAILPTPEGEIPCPRCGGRVFTAELMLAKGRPYHKKCFKCKACKRPLDSMVHCDGPDNEIYCKLCYAKKYGPKGYGFAAGGGGVLVAENIPGGEDMPGVNPASATLDVTKIKAEEGKGCPRCGGKVFMAEEINVRQRSFHKRCYNCCFCHRPLDSVTGCDSPDGEVYCKLCYAKKYGPKGYGFAAGGGGVLVAENIGGIDDTSKMEAKKADTGRLDTAKIQAEKGKGCPRCGGKVFMAEEMHARGRSYHKRCYNCCHCHRPLDSMVGCDAPDGEIYCKLCYAKKYGPKGYGFAAGCGGVLVAENIPGGRDDDGSESKALMGAIDTTSIPAAPGEGCPRCGGKVFTAEEKLSRNKKWHKRCYSCRECFRPLDSMVLCDGPDGDIYCKLCYAKKYGPKGYGFAAGAGGVLVPENFAGEDDFDYLGLESEDGVPKQRPAKAAFTVLDVTKFPAKEGQSRCPRCGGAVFQAEAMPCRGKEWHKRCYNCCECHRPLDSMLSCDAPDGEIYCKLCYAKRHGPKGYGYGHMPALVSLGTEDGCPMPTDIRQFGFGGKGPQPQVPRQAPPPGPPHVRTPGGMPTPLVGSYPPQQVHTIISPPKPMPIDQGIPVPRGFESSATHWGMGPVQAHGGSSQTVTVLQSAASSSSQSSSHQVNVQGSSTRQVFVQGSSSQETSSTVHHTATKVVTQVQEVHEHSSSSSSSTVVTASVVGGESQGQVTRIITGVHMDGGSPVPIVAGVSSGYRNDFMPNYPDDQMYAPDGNLAFQDPQANIPPEMLADMVAHQSAIAAQNAQMMISQQRSLMPYNDRNSEVSSHHHSSAAAISSQHQTHIESVHTQQISMTSEFSSSSHSEQQMFSQTQSASDPMSDSHPASAFHPEFELQKRRRTQNEDLLPEPGEPLHDQYQEDASEFLEPEDEGFSPGPHPSVQYQEIHDASDM